MLGSVAIAAVLLAATTIVHAIAMAIVMRGARSRFVESRTVAALPPGEHGHELSRVLCVAGVVFAMLFAAIVEAGIWAGAYVGLGAIDGMEPALYFSMVTYTTVGYGDLSLDPPWRLLASLQGGSGVLMFGWSTALIVAAVQKMYAHPGGARG